MHKHSARFLLSHWDLLWRVARNEMAARYAGSLLGAGWALLSPLFTLAIYSVVYLLILKVSVPGLTQAQYVLQIFAGLVPLLATSEALMGGVGSVVANRAVLANTVFPIDLVPAKAALLGQSPMVVGVVVVLGASYLNGAMYWTVALLPIVWFLHLLALVGINWILSLVNIVFRDLQNLLGMVVTLMMIASPIAYTAEMVPPRLQFFIRLNPFAYFVIAYQDVLVRGRVPDLLTTAALVVLGAGVFWAGGWFFARAKMVVIDYV